MVQTCNGHPTDRSHTEVDIDGRLATFDKEKYQRTSEAMEELWPCEGEEESMASGSEE